MSQPLCQRSWSWPVLWRPTRHSRTVTKKKKKDVLFILGDWNAKVGIFPRFHAKIRAVLAKERERTVIVRQTYWHWPTFLSFQYVVLPKDTSQIKVNSVVSPSLKPLLIMLSLGSSSFRHGSLILSWGSPICTSSFCTISKVTIAFI